jgi:hypothetical protein
MFEFTTFLFGFTRFFVWVNEIFSFFFCLDLPYAPFIEYQTFIIIILIKLYSVLCINYRGNYIIICNKEIVDLFLHLMILFRVRSGEEYGNNFFVCVRFRYPLFRKKRENSCCFYLPSAFVCVCVCDNEPDFCVLLN